MDIIKILTAINLIDEDIVKEANITQDPPLYEQSEDLHPYLSLKTKTTK